MVADLNVHWDEGARWLFGCRSRLHCWLWVLKGGATSNRRCRGCRRAPRRNRRFSKRKEAALPGAVLGAECDQFQRDLNRRDHLLYIEPLAHSMDVTHTRGEIHRQQSAAIEDVRVAGATRPFGTEHAAGAACCFDHALYEGSVFGDAHTLIVAMNTWPEPNKDWFAPARSLVHPRAGSRAQPVHSRAPPAAADAPAPQSSPLPPAGGVLLS